MFNKMKDLFLFCLSIIMLFTFAGCSSGADRSSNPSVSAINATSTNPANLGSNTENNTDPSISSTGLENNTASPSQSPLAPTPSVKPATNIPHIRPARPFPDFPPNYLQFLPQWLLNDFNDGNFVVGRDGIAANYQVWYEFICKVNKNKDAELTIQTFDIDSLKDILDSARFQMAGRYRLSLAGNQTVWKYLTDDKDDVTGNLSFTYNAETGLHEVFIGGKKVFEFIYFPYDPKQSALYFGYTPLEELPSAYSKVDAIKDGCLVIEQGVIQNINVLRNFRDMFEQYHDAGIFIRIFFEDDEGITIKDVGSYNERNCITVDYSRSSSHNDIEDMYVTTYYDNSSVGIEINYDACSLDLGSDFRETVFIFKDVPFRK